MANLIERHREKIVGVLSCFDRLVLQGTLPSVAYPQAVATELDTYKYYLTQLGRHVAIAGLTLKNMFLVPEFARATLAYSSPNPCFSAINRPANGLPLPWAVRR